MQAKARSDWIHVCRVQGMFHKFLLDNKEEVLGLTEKKTLELAGSRPSSDQLKLGLPIFFDQLLGILQLRRPVITKAVAHLGEAARGAE